MHLINTGSLELHEFLNDDQLPPYAILSHTWEQQEVSFHDMQPRKEKPHVILMKGYDKIARCCQQAFQSGLEWAWVDTCCIDKSSSAALSESINAMYRWHKNAAICYAYLSDITPGDYKVHGLGSSRWFTRGWTLQELIAPKTVVFFSPTWKKLSTKHRLQHKLQAITGVPRAFLLGHEDMSEASIAMRMSWAAREDVAYCRRILPLRSLRHQHAIDLRRRREGISTSPGRDYQSTALRTYHLRLGQLHHSE